MDHGKGNVNSAPTFRLQGNAGIDSIGFVYKEQTPVTDSVSELFHKQPQGKGVKVTTYGDRIYIDVYVIIKFGVSINAVAESLKEGVKYRVEKFTGMIVDTVNVNIIGVRL